METREVAVSPSELFGTSIETVVGKFREMKARSAALKSFMLRRSRATSQATNGTGSSRSEDRRREQKASAASRAPPPSGVEHGGGVSLVRGKITSGKWSITSALSGVLELQRLTNMCLLHPSPFHPLTEVKWDSDVRYNWP